jgi:hypothetical protein
MRQRVAGRLREGVERPDELDLQVAARPSEAPLVRLLAALQVGGFQLGDDVGRALGSGRRRRCRAAA